MKKRFTEEQIVLILKSDQLSYLTSSKTGTCLPSSSTLNLTLTSSFIDNSS